MGEFLLPASPDSISMTVPVKSTYGRSATDCYTSLPTVSDPYRYMVGFGNRFASEAVYATSRPLSEQCVLDVPC
jgi:homogentisate 1,2-dioxygenase